MSISSVFPSMPSSSGISGGNSPSPLRKLVDLISACFAKIQESFARAREGASLVGRVTPLKLTSAAEVEQALTKYSEEASSLEAAQRLLEFLERASTVDLRNIYKPELSQQHLNFLLDAMVSKKFGYERMVQQLFFPLMLHDLALQKEIQKHFQDELGNQGLAALELYLAIGKAASGSDRDQLAMAQKFSLRRYLPILSSWQSDPKIAAAIEELPKSYLDEGAMLYQIRSLLS